MRTPRLLIATVAVLGLLATGCGSDDDATIDPGSGDAAADCMDGVDCDDTVDGGDAGGAAGTCLAGAEDCQDTGGDMGAPPPLGMCAADAPDCDDMAGDPNAPVVDEPLPADGVGEPGEMEPRFVEPTDGLINLRPIAWEGADVDEDDQAVTVRWWSGVEPCNALHAVEVAYGEDTIELTVIEGSTADDVACIEIAEYKAFRVQLDEPIDGRGVVDGSQG